MYVCTYVCVTYVLGPNLSTIRVCVSLSLSLCVYRPLICKVDR